MSKKNYVLDSNVLINDPLCMFKFDDNDVTIPLIVLEEIDSFKKEESSRAQSSRRINRELDKLRELGSLHDGVKLETGGILRVECTCPEPTFSNASSKSYADNIILQTFLDMRNSNRDVEYVLVTKDINLRVRADALGITVEDYENMKVEDVSFYEAVPVLDFLDEEIDQLYAEQFLYNGEDYGVSCNSYVVLKNQDTSKSALAVVNDEGGFNLVRKETAYGLTPKNKEQTFAMDALLDPDIHLVVLTGVAGTGKTLQALSAGLELVINKNKYDQLIIARPVIEMGKEMGFLPGDLDEKLSPWMGPIYDNFDFLTRNAVKGARGAEGFKQLQHFGKVDIQALGYIRGRSFANKFLLIDESQSLTRHEMKTIITRAGQGTKIVCVGDVFQIDNPYLDVHSNGLTYLIDKFKGQKLFAHVHLTKGERSALAELAAELL